MRTDETTVSLVKVRSCPGFGGQPCGRPVDQFATHCDSCEADIQNQREIASLLCELTRQVENAAMAAAKASRDLGQLMSDRVYDIELAEGTDGADAAYELEVAARALRNVRRIVAERRALESGERP